MPRIPNVGLLVHSERSEALASARRMRARRSVLKAFQASGRPQVGAGDKNAAGGNIWQQDDAGGAQVGCGPDASRDFSLTRKR